MDPLLLQLIARGVARLGPYAINWAKGPLSDRLAAALAGRMEEDEYQLLSFESLANDPEYQELIEAAFQHLQLDEARAASVIHRHVDDIRGDAETSELVGRVLDLLVSLLPMFATGGSPALGLQTGLLQQESARQQRHLESKIDELAAALEAANTPASIDTPLLIDRQWLSGRAGDAWARLIEADAHAAADLQAELGDEPDGQKIRTFLETTETASAAVWETVMSIADEAGEAELAQEAAIRYAGSAGADRVRGLAWAAGLADQREDADERDRLMAEAEALDAQHPTLLLLQARLTTDPHERLELLEKVEPVDARQMAALEGQLALSYLQAGDLDAAFKAIERAKQADPGELLTLEVEATLIVLEAREGRGLTWQRAEAALANMERVRERLRAAKRFDVSVQIAGRMTQVYQLFGGGPNEIRAIADDLLPEETQRDEAAQVAAALLAVGDAPDALKLLPPQPQDEFAKFIYASALLGADHQRFLQDGIPMLDALLQAEDEAVGTEAAWLRAGAALLDQPAPESAEALKVLDERDPIRARLHRAAAAERTDPDEAERILTAGGEQAELLIERGRLAARTDNWDKAIPLYERAVQRDPSPINQLAFAEALREAGRLDEAREQALNIARRADYAPFIRDTAYRIAYTLVQQSGDIASQAGLAEEWMEITETPKVAWSFVWALARLARYEDARSIIERKGLSPTEEQDAELYADVVIHTSRPAEALETLLRVHEAVPDVRAVEARITMLAHTVARDDVDPDLMDRAVAISQAYPQRFPDGGMEQIDIDPADPLAAIKPQLEQHAQAVAAASEALAQGQIPIAALAAASGRDVGTLLLSLNMLPLGSGSSEIDAAELDAARQAIDNPVIWESTAINIAGGLGPALFEKIRASFQTPTIAQAVLEDARLGAHDALAADPSGTLGMNPTTGEVFYHEYVPGELDRLTHRAKSILKLVDGLNVVPNTGQANEGDIGKWVREEGHLDNTALATAEATLAVVERTRYSLYSDDPRLRAAARQLGVGAFGTAALLAAMQERGTIDVEEAADAVRVLLRSGTQGIPVDLFDPITEARAADWDLTTELRTFILDPRRWNNELDANLQRWHGFLRVACIEAAPWQFQRWVFRLADSLVLSLPDTNSPELLLAALAMAALGAETTEEERRYRRRLLNALDFARKIYGIEKSLGTILHEWQERAEASSAVEESSLQHEDAV